jgi:protein-arginine deiminase
MNNTMKGFINRLTVQSPITTIDTTWLSVGHIDELISFVPTTTYPYFKMLIASPQCAIDILIGLSNTNKSGLVLFDWKTDRYEQPISITVGSILTGTDTINMTQCIQTKINGIKSILQQGLGTEFDIIEIPVLFTATWTSEAKTDVTYATAWSPNMVNSLVIGSTIIVPKPFGPKDPSDNYRDQFEKDVANKLEASNVYFIDDWDTYHKWFGEVHCGTNAKRTPPTNINWWEQQQ